MQEKENEISSYTLTLQDVKFISVCGIYIHILLLVGVLCNLNLEFRTTRCPNVLCEYAVQWGYFILLLFMIFNLGVSGITLFIVQHERELHQYFSSISKMYRILTVLGIIVLVSAHFPSDICHAPKSKTIWYFWSAFVISVCILLSLFYENVKNEVSEYNNTSIGKSINDSTFEAIQKQFYGRSSFDSTKEDISQVLN